MAMHPADLQARAANGVNAIIAAQEALVAEFWLAALVQVKKLTWTCFGCGLYDFRPPLEELRCLLPFLLAARAGNKGTGQPERYSAVFTIGLGLGSMFSSIPLLRMVDGDDEEAGLAHLWNPSFVGYGPLISCI